MLNTTDQLLLLYIFNHFTSIDFFSFLYSVSDLSHRLTVFFTDDFFLLEQEQTETGLCNLLV